MNKDRHQVTVFIYSASAASVPFMLSAPCRRDTQRQPILGHGAAGQAKALCHGCIVQRWGERRELPDEPLQLVHAAAMVRLAEKAAQGPGVMGQGDGFALHHPAYGGYAEARGGGHILQPQGAQGLRAVKGVVPLHIQDAGGNGQHRAAVKLQIIHQHGGLLLAASHPLGGHIVGFGLQLIAAETKAGSEAPGQTKLPARLAKVGVNIRPDIDRLRYRGKGGAGIGIQRTDQGKAPLHGLHAAVQRPCDAVYAPGGHIPQMLPEDPVHIGVAAVLPHCLLRPERWPLPPWLLHPIHG